VFGVDYQAIPRKTSGLLFSLAFGISCVLERDLCSTLTFFVTASAIGWGLSFSGGGPGDLCDDDWGSGE
jgi:hypothetical protein